MTDNHHIPQPLPGPLCPSFAALLPVLNEPAVDAHAAAEARAHAATCAYCQSQLATYDRLEAALRRHLGPAETPRRHAEDIMRDLMNDQPLSEADLTISTPPTPLPGPRGPGRSRRFISGLAAMAAVLATVMIIATLFFSRSRYEYPGPAAGRTPTPAITVSPTTGLVRGSDTELNAISMVSPTEGWAVGSYQDQNTQQSLLLHYHNGVWSQYVGPAGLASIVGLNSISMVSATDGWAVGEGSLALHYDGKNWNPVSSPIRGCSAFVQMLSATDGWITGCDPSGAASIFHYDGHAWTAQPLPAGLHPNHFFGLSMVSPTEGWAIGNTDSAISGLIQGSSGAGTNGFILHYKDGQWTVQSAYQSTNFWSLSMSSASDGWAAGSTFVNNNPVPFLVHYTQGHWMQVANPLPGTHADSFYVVHMTSATDGWLATDQDTRTGLPTLLHWNGTAWTVTNLPAISDTASLLITDIATLSAGDAWAVGFRTSGPEEGLPVNGGYQPTTLPVLFHYSNGAWQVVRSQ
jgi:hypothetical protein